MLKSIFSIWQTVVQKLIKGRIVNSGFNPKGFYTLEHWRDGRLLKAYRLANDITNVGKNYIFEVMFHDGTQIASTSWYIGLISSSGYSALAAGDTMASHAGWTEFTTYSQSNRVAWGPGAASSQQITNATPATFDMTGSGTVKGLFVVTNNSKGGTSGTLWSTALFNADVPVVNGDQLKVSYTVNA